MFNASNALYKAKTKVICGDSYNNGLDDGTIVIGYLYHDIGAYFIKVFDVEHADYVSYEIDPDTVGVFTGKTICNNALDPTDKTQIFVNDIIFNTHTDVRAIVIYDENEYRFAVKTKDNEIIPFNEWDWEWTCALGYKPPETDAVKFDDVELPETQLNMITPLGIFRATGYNVDNEYVGITVEFVPNDNERAKTFKPTVSLDLNTSGEVRALIYDGDEDPTEEYEF